MSFSCEMINCNQTARLNDRPGGFLQSWSHSASDFLSSANSIWEQATLMFILVFFKSISHLSYTNCNVRVKSKAPTRSTFWATGGAIWPSSIYVNINAQSTIFNVLIKQKNMNPCKCYTLGL